MIGADVQRRKPSVVPFIHLSTHAEQRLHKPFAAVLSGEVQRCIAYTGEQVNATSR